MKKIAILSLIVVVALLGTGCLQSKEYQSPTRKGGAEVKWELAGSWGGEAEISQASSDLWQVRFQPGGFKLISGLCATDDEVWVCDLGISRLQIFDFEGNFLRSIGEGMPLRGLEPGEIGTLPTDLELHELYQQGGISYEEQHLDKWLGKEKTRFAAADVAVAENGYYIADQVRLKIIKEAPRAATMVFIPFNGEVVRAHKLSMFWPDYLCVQGTRAAISQPQNSNLTLLEVGGIKWPQKQLGNQNNHYERMVKLKVEGCESIRFHQDMAYLAGASTDAIGFNRPSGLALAFDKLLVCDTGNRRLKVYDARRDDPLHWAQLVALIGNTMDDLTLRFNHPLDIDVDPAGLSYVLDEGEGVNRPEVVILDESFYRLGSFGGSDLLEPKYLDLSDDGRHCFVTDRFDNKVWHYVRTD